MPIKYDLRKVESLNLAPSRYVYRAVSPHGHVYWEIDPNYVLLSQQQQQHAQQQQPLLLEEQLQQQLQLAESASGGGGDTSSSRESSARFNSSGSSSEQRPLISSPPPPAAAQAFVRTGASRFGRRPTPAEIPGDATDNSGKPPEQLQTQVQIKDCRAVKVNVKSSEYIEAKIRTLRKNNNVVVNN